MLTLDQLAAFRPLAPRTAGSRVPDAIREHAPSPADIITLLSFGLGAWWAVGGPTWAAIASIIGDELDGRLARATGSVSERGSALDWGSDVTLTTMTLMKLGYITQHQGLAIAAAVPVLYTQATLRAKGWRPPVLSARAILMLGTILVEKAKA